MKRFIVFESAVIGFFFGVIVAAYMAFLDGTGGYVGQILNWISLRPILGPFSFSADELLVVSFIVTVVAFSIYGCIAGILVRYSKKALFAIIPVILALAVAVFFQQRGGSAEISMMPMIEYPRSGGFARSVSTTTGQYFGVEAAGDLNGDGVDDVAFILSRKDPDRGALYYLSAALATSTGHQGTNIVFLGNGIKPTGIYIDDGIIAVPYTTGPDNASSTAYATVNGGGLSIVDPGGHVGSSLFSGSMAGAGSSWSFQPCGTSTTLWVAAPSSVYATLGSTTPIFVVLTGQIAAAPQKGPGALYQQQLELGSIVKIRSEDACPALNP